MRKVVIAGSAKFWREAQDFKKVFEDSGFKVLACVEEEGNSGDWRKLYAGFYSKLSEADDIFVLNLDKNGVSGYIGYETFAELSSMVVRKTNGEDVRVLLYQWPGEECGCYEGIMEMKNNGWVELFAFS